MPVGTESPPAPSKERLQVGSWAVEPALNQLSAAGRTVKLEPKAMAVLVYLANRPGQVVSREELLSAVWSGVVVSDDSLTQVVIKLRKALGDAPEDPAYIQTISKGGYRLVAPVVRSAEISSAPVRPDSERLYAERKRRVPWIAGAGMAALLVAAAGAWWIMGERVTPMAGTEAARMAQPTVAIRPFEALGNDPQEVLLARGITADLLTDLSKVSGLWVIGFAPMDGRAGGEAPSDAPPVRYLVSGTVQRVDERLRLHVHLTDRETGKQLWSDQINPDVPETYWVLAYVHAQRRQHEQALQYLQTAVRLYPSFADGYALMGSVNTFAGHPADAVPLLRTAMRLNLESGYLYFLVLGRAYLFLGDLEQARVNLEQALTRNAENLEAHVYMAAVHVAAGNKTSASWEAEEIRTLQPGFSGRRWLETYPMTDIAQKTKLMRALGELGF